MYGRRGEEKGYGSGGFEVNGVYEGDGEESLTYM